jgi:hypothetical protein
MATIGFFLRLGTFAAASALARQAAAGSPDPSTLRDQLEDQVLDGDRDAEDVAAMRAAPSLVGRDRRAGSAYLSLMAFAGDRPSGGRELGAMLVLGLPLERFAAPRRFAPSVGAPLDGEGRDASGEPTSGEDLLPRGPSALAEGPAERDRAAKGAVVMTTEVARSCVRAAWRVAGVADDGAIDSMVSRARASAALPELRLRLMRTMDASGRATLSDTDPYRYVETGGVTTWLEARLTFRLDRLLFADDEIPLERVRMDRYDLRARTAAKVLAALFEWQRAYALVSDTGLSSAEHFAAVVRELEASAILDVMTDGWFGRFRASLAPPS